MLLLAFGAGGATLISAIAVLTYRKARRERQIYYFHDSV